MIRKKIDIDDRQSVRVGTDMHDKVILHVYGEGGAGISTMSASQARKVAEALIAFAVIAED